jgi:DNA polymerase-3 subunit chi
MAEVLFYHLTRTPLEVTLPDLLTKSRARGWNVVVRAGSAERLDWLDQRLWLGADTSFLAHGLAGGGADADQPILLTTGTDVPNNADILFAVDRATVSASEANDFARVCVVFDGNDEPALTQAREQWKMLTDAGLPAKYWSQEGGGWAEKASKNVPSA